MRDIGKNIKALRIQKNMTQDALAEQLFVTRQTVSNYETGKSHPDVEMLAKIAEVLETDGNTVLYGPAPAQEKTPMALLALGGTLTTVLIVIRMIFLPYANAFRASFSIWPVMLVYALLDPLIWLTAGWTLTQMLTMALKKGPLKGRYVPCLRRVLAVLLALWLVILVPYLAVFSLDDYLYTEKIRGQWVDHPYESDGEIVMGKGWERIPLPALAFLEPLGIPVVQQSFLHRQFFFIPGIALCLLDFPPRRKQTAVDK